jgi:exopolysaccharide biosynthesis predicted pyruvyltransferase EpsI
MSTAQITKMFHDYSPKNTFHVYLQVYTLVVADRVHTDDFSALTRIGH